MKIIKELKEKVYVIKDCRRKVRRSKGTKHPIRNTKFLAYIASVPEWTITIFNR